MLPDQSILRIKILKLLPRTQQSELDSVASILLKNEITEKDFTNSFTHTSNLEFIKDKVLKYNFYSELDHTKTRDINLHQAARKVWIDGIEVHLLLNWSLIDDQMKFGLWGYPDEKKYIEKFSRIFDAFYDIHKNRSIQG